MPPSRGHFFDERRSALWAAECRYLLFEGKTGLVSCLLKRIELLEASLQLFVHFLRVGYVSDLRDKYRFSAGEFDRFRSGLFCHNEPQKNMLMPQLYIRRL